MVCYPSSLAGRESIIADMDFWVVGGSVYTHSGFSYFINSQRFQYCPPRTAVTLHQVSQIWRRTMRPVLCFPWSSSHRDVHTSLSSEESPQESQTDRSPDYKSKGDSSTLNVSSYLPHYHQHQPLQTDCCTQTSYLTKLVCLLCYV